MHNSVCGEVSIMKLLELFDIKKNNIDDEQTLLKQITSAYKKLSLKYHPDRTNGDPISTEKFRQITAVYELFNKPAQRKYYFANHHLIDNVGNIPSIIGYVNENAVDVDKENKEAAINVFTRLDFSSNQQGLNDIESAISAVNKPNSANPFYQYTRNLSDGVKRHFLNLLSERKEGINKAIETSAYVLKQQDFVCNNNSLNAINEQISQIGKNNYDVIPKALLRNVNEGLREDLICAYLYCLTCYKKRIDFVCNAVKNMGFQYSQESLTRINAIIARLSLGDYEGIPCPQVTTNVDKYINITALYLDRLNQFKAPIESIYERANAVMKQQNIGCNQQGFVVITKMLRQFSNLNFEKAPQELFTDIASNKKARMTTAYHELLLIEHKKFITLKGKKIDEILEELSRRVNSADQEIQTAANSLLDELKNAKTSYLTNLGCLDVEPDVANQQFDLKCHTAIDAARSVLERDLGWDIYLTKLLNLLKVMLNGVIWLASFGNSSNFFKEDLRVLEKAEQDLNYILR